MADYSTNFSCLFDVGSAENAARPDAVRSEIAAELDRDRGEHIGFQMEVDHLLGPGVLRIHSDGQGGPGHVTAFVLRCAGAFGLTGRWGFCWSNTCSRPRLDGNGGGAAALDLDRRVSTGELDRATWLAVQLAPVTRAEGDPEAAVP